MDQATSFAGGQHAVAAPQIPEGRKTAGRWLIGLSTFVLVAVTAVEILQSAQVIAVGFETWRPVLYIFVLWSVALGAGQVLIRGEEGHRALFLLPALLFTVAMVVFPTLFGITIDRKS